MYHIIFFRFVSKWHNPNRKKFSMKFKYINLKFMCICACIKKEIMQVWGDIGLNEDKTFIELFL